LGILDNLIGIKEASKELGIHETNVRKFVKTKLEEGKDYIRIDKTYVILKKSLKKYKPIK
jgi:hypothetical protein